MAAQAEKELAHNLAEVYFEHRTTLARQQLLPAFFSLNRPAVKNTELMEFIGKNIGLYGWVLLHHGVRHFRRRRL